jgi:hypothetical protein
LNEGVLAPLSRGFPPGGARRVTTKWQRNAQTPCSIGSISGPGAAKRGGIPPNSRTARSPWTPRTAAVPLQNRRSGLFSGLDGNRLGETCTVDGTDYGARPAPITPVG